MTPDGSARECAPATEITASLMLVAASMIIDGVRADCVSKSIELDATTEDARGFERRDRADQKAVDGSGRAIRDTSDLDEAQSRARAGLLRVASTAGLAYAVDNRATPW